MDAMDLFSKLGGTDAETFPAIHSEARETPRGTPYLRDPGVVLLARPSVSVAGLEGFLAGFDDSLEFDGYLDDPTRLEGGSLLVKTAGQTCYSSFGPKRTYNKDAGRYFGNLINSGHGSVLEHATFSFFIYGISRSNSHEIVRHRAGTAFSQLSQRFVSGRVLRFVERPEYVNVPSLHRLFEERIDRAAEEYEAVATELLALQEEGNAMLHAEARTDLRKRVQQTARSVIPNEAETTMVLTGNVRAWRHMIEMRTSPHAESEIRALYLRIFLCLRLLEPLLFEDYELAENPDGTFTATTPSPKV